MRRFSSISPGLVWGVVIVGVMAISRLSLASIILLPTRFKVQWRSL